MIKRIWAVIQKEFIQTYGQHQIAEAGAVVALAKQDDLLAGPTENEIAVVEALLAADSEAHDLLDGNALDVAAPLIGADLEGRDIGPYRLLRRLGEGGMGVVHLAERADGPADVALPTAMAPRSMANVGPWSDQPGELAPVSSVAPGGGVLVTVLVPPD